MLANGCFSPEDILCLKGALDRSVRVLAFAFPDTSTALEAGRVRQLLADRILSLAALGERDPIRLSNQALGCLPAYRSPVPESGRRARE
jgi:hypothetical protein